MAESPELWYILPSTDRPEALHLLTQLCERLAVETPAIDGQGYFWLPSRPVEIASILGEITPDRRGKALLRQA